MKKETIFEPTGQFRSCHASTLAHTNDGKVIAAWFAGSHEGHADVAIWMSRKLSAGWEKPRKIAKICEKAHWNPVLFNPGNGIIYLYFKVGEKIPSWKTWSISSVDDGDTWSEPLELVEGDQSGGRGPVKNKPIVLSDASWLAPASVETATEWRAFCDRSKDNGMSWKKSNLIGFEDSSMAGRGVIQPTLWESAPGKVHMLLRSTCGKICRSDSDDYGKTWAQVRETELPNNNSGIDLVRLANGALALVCNPTEERTRRTPLSLLVSTDNGNTWGRRYDIEEEDVNVGHLIRNDGGEFSYPSIISMGNEICVVYTRHRKLIGYMEDEIRL